MIFSFEAVLEIRLTTLASTFVFLSYLLERIKAIQHGLKARRVCYESWQFSWLFAIQSGSEANQDELEMSLSSIPMEETNGYGTHLIQR